MTLSSPIIEGSLDDHVGQSQESPASTRPSAAINAFVTDEENVLARDSPLPPTPSYSPTPSPSFEVIRIYPGCDVEFSEVTTLPSSLNPSPVQRRPSQPPVGSKNSRDPKFERVVLVALAWTFVFICGFGLLLLLVECTHGVYACSLMVFLSLNLGAHLVMNKCVKKRRVRNPVDVVIRGREYESAVFDIPEDGHSSVVQINGRFEISSLRSSQDIFRSELLMNGQIISVCVDFFPLIYLSNTNIGSLLLAGMLFPLEHQLSHLRHLT
jgi:hypothetical protein